MILLAETNPWIFVVGSLGGAFIGAIAGCFTAVIVFWLTARKERKFKALEALGNFGAAVYTYLDALDFFTAVARTKVPLTMTPDVQELAKATYGGRSTALSAKARLYALLDDPELREQVSHFWKQVEFAPKKKLEELGPGSPRYIEQMWKHVEDMQHQVSPWLEWMTEAVNGRKQIVTEEELKKMTRGLEKFVAENAAGGKGGKTNSQQPVVTQSGDHATPGSPAS